MCPHTCPHTCPHACPAAHTGRELRILQHVLHGHLLLLYIFTLVWYKGKLLRISEMYLFRVSSPAAMPDAAASSPPTPAQRRPRPPTEEPPPPWSFPPPRPLSERVVDYGILSSICGGTYGAMRAARHGSSTLIAALWVGGHWVLASSCFLGARELLIQDDWANDREGVSGMAAAITGGGFAGLYVGRKAIPRACAGFFVGGFAMHYAHRWCAPCLAHAQRTRTHLTPGVLPAPTGSFDYG